MRYQVLGPLRATRDGDDVPLGGPQQRLVLAMLLAENGRPVSTNRLIDGIWGEDEPATAKKALQGYIHHLRTQVGDDLKTEGSGYSLATNGDLDVQDFERLREEAAEVRAVDPDRAAVLFREALDLWNGPPYADLGDYLALGPEIARLEDMRITALGDRIDADLALGRHTALIGELEALTQEFPLHERFRAQHMTALYRAGRQVEALRSYERMRRHLADEMGLEPSSDLRDLENRILSDDDELRGPRPEGTTDPVAVRGYELRDVVATTPSGRTYRAYQRSIGRQVAVRMLDAEIADDPEFIANFHADTKKVAALEHPNINVVFDTWREPGHAYQVSRWFGGGSLADVLATGRLSQSRALGVLDEVGDALGHAHRSGVAHGHVAPSNVMLDESGHAYLSDFVVGASESPTAEQDRFDLAVLAHTLLVGRQPRMSDGGASADVDELPDSVAGVFELAFSGDGYARPEQFVRALRQASGVDVGGPPEPQRRTEVRNPYKGLQAFQELDADDFYGRDEVIERLVQRLERHRLVAVVGPSGSGKSSAVKAGLLPRLRSVDDGTVRLISEMYPGAYPFEELEDALVRVGVNGTGVLDELVADDRGLARAVRRMLPGDTSELILVIDQFEELFSMVTDEDARQLFLDSLTAATTDPRSRLRVVITMRADFFDRPLGYPRFGELLEAALVPLQVPNHDELAAAVAEPARSLGVEFEEGLIERIVQDVEGQPGGLPLLQYALTELFDARESNRITLATYQRGGGVFGALARRAEELYDDLPPAGQHAIRHALLRMVTVDEAADDLRRRVRRAELRARDIDDRELATALQVFGAHRLLTFDLDPNTSTPTVEVAHEALLREWPRLRSWIDEQRDDLVIRRRLDAALAEWKASGEEDSYLPTGSRLAQFEDWSRSTSLALGLAEQSFLEAAIQKQAETQARAVARRRLLSIGLAVVAAVLAVLAGFALIQKGNADDAAAEARANAEQATKSAEVAEAALRDAEIATLISRSAAQSTSDPELSLLLALEAHRRSPSAETEYAVLNALGSARSPNRLASFGRLDTGDCPVPPEISADGLWAHEMVDGRLTSLDLTTGEVSDHGAAGESCGFYIGDPSADWAALGFDDGETHFVGPYDDPFAVELQQQRSGPLWLDPESDASTGLVFGFIRRANGDLPAVLFDTTTGDQVGEPIGQGSPWRGAVDPSGSLFAVSHQELGGASTPGQLRVVRVGTGDQLLEIETPAPVSSLRFDRAGSELTAGTASGEILTIDLETGDVISVVATTATSPIRELAIRPGGLVVALSEGQVETVDRFSGPIGDSTDLRDVVRARLRDDGLVVILRSDQTYDLIDLGGSTLIERSWTANTGVVAFEDGLATVMGEPSTLVDLATGERSPIEVRDVDGGEFPVHRLYPDADGLLGVTGRGGRGILARWEDGEMVERVELPGDLTTWYRVGDLIAAVGRDANGNEIATLSSLERGSAGIRFTVPAQGGTAAHPTPDGGMHVFDAGGTLRSYAADGERLLEIETGVEDVWLVAVDPTLEWLAAVPSVEAPVVIDLVTGEVAEMPGPRNIVNLQFTGSGDLLVVTGADGDVTVWDVERQQLAGLAWDGTGANVAPQSWYDESTDSMWVFTSARIIEIPLVPQRWVARACSFVGRDLTPDEWNRYVPGDSTPQSACT